ncbi:nuclear transport factor 2 family protein [Agromyces endophyticus]|uniref:nuclear transport factor 2 family protein n=1 Tax=Agromyces sp. H17E-10 TaxID=2932244 RepID=UPI001FD28E96|nr:nuclear transport factor 2 family protein [Agromyces sp. H17E-10]UOQ90541.1 nuclear transport factor 2 family protein [Agromyces sp. H17E-10]
MTEQTLPAPIAAFIDATNRGDREAFVAAFTDDAYLNDWGREFHGHRGVRSWDETDNIGVQSHFELVGFVAGEAEESWIVTLSVSGNGYNGTGPMEFSLRDGRISSLVIS